MLEKWAWFITYQMLHQVQTVLFLYDESLYFDKREGKYSSSLPLPRTISWSTHTRHSLNWICLMQEKAACKVPEASETPPPIWKVFLGMQLMPPKILHAATTRIISSLTQVQGNLLFWQSNTSYDNMSTALQRSARPTQSHTLRQYHSCSPNNRDLLIF